MSNSPVFGGGREDASKLPKAIQVAAIQLGNALKEAVLHTKGLSHHNEPNSEKTNPPNRSR